MRRIVRIFSIMSLFAFGLTAAAFGQERTGDIDGTVNDQNTAAVAGAEIEVRPESISGSGEN